MNIRGVSEVGPLESYWTLWYRTGQLKKKVDVVEVCFSWCDQGYGECAGALELKLCHGAHVAVKKRAHDPEGSGMGPQVVCRRPLATVTHRKKTLKFRFDRKDPLITLYKPGMYYELWYLIGSGGNKKLFISDASIFIYNHSERDIDTKIKQLNPDDGHYLSSLVDYLQRNIYTSPLQQKHTVADNTALPVDSQELLDMSNKISEKIHVAQELKDSKDSDLRESELKAATLNDDYIANLFWNYNFYENGAELRVENRVLKTFNCKVSAISKPKEKKAKSKSEASADPLGNSTPKVSPNAHPGETLFGMPKPAKRNDRILANIANVSHSAKPLRPRTVEKPTRHPVEANLEAIESSFNLYYKNRCYTQEDAQAQPPLKKNLISSIPQKACSNNLTQPTPTTHLDQRIPTNSNSTSTHPKSYKTIKPSHNKHTSTLNYTKYGSMNDQNPYYNQKFMGYVTKLKIKNDNVNAENYFNLKFIDYTVKHKKPLASNKMSHESNYVGSPKYNHSTPKVVSIRELSPRYKIMQPSEPTSLERTDSGPHFGRINERPLKFERGSSPSFSPDSQELHSFLGSTNQKTYPSLLHQELNVDYEIYLENHERHFTNLKKLVSCNEFLFLYFGASYVEEVQPAQLALGLRQVREWFADMNIPTELLYVSWDKAFDNLKKISSQLESFHFCAEDKYLNLRISELYNVKRIPSLLLIDKHSKKISKNLIIEMDDINHLKEKLLTLVKRK